MTTTEPGAVLAGAAATAGPPPGTAAELAHLARGAGAQRAELRQGQLRGLGRRADLLRGAGALPVRHRGGRPGRAGVQRRADRRHRDRPGPGRGRRRRWWRRRGLRRRRSAAWCDQNDSAKRAAELRPARCALVGVGLHRRVHPGLQRRSTGCEEGRPVWKLRPVQIGLAAITLVLLAVVATGLIVSGPVTDAVGDLINAGGLARTAWSVGQVAGARDDHDGAAVACCSGSRRTSGSRGSAGSPRAARWPWSPGRSPPSASASTWPTSARTTPPTAASARSIAFLVWLYLSNSALMLGVQINAELQRGRVLQAGEPDPDEPVLPPKTPADDVTRSAGAGCRPRRSGQCRFTGGATG